MGGLGGAESFAVVAFRFVRVSLSVCSLLVVMIEVVEGFIRTVENSLARRILSFEVTPVVCASIQNPRSCKGAKNGHVFRRASRVLPRFDVCFRPRLVGCFGFSAGSSPSEWTARCLTFSFTSLESRSGSSFLESQSVSSRIMAQAITPSFLANAMPAFLRRLVEPPWIRANVRLLQVLKRVLIHAHSSSKVRSSFDPRLLIRPLRLILPDWYCFGVRPR